MSPHSFVYDHVIADVTAAAPAGEEAQINPTERMGALFDVHHERLYRLARRLSRDGEDARDLVQETFLRVARSPLTVPAGIVREEAWLVRILVNICRDRWRQRAARKRLDMGNAGESAPHRSDQEAALVAHTVVWSALHQLAPRRRAVVVMYELEGLPIVAIARQLGVTAVTVRWHLSRGRRELAAIVGRTQGLES